MRPMFPTGLLERKAHYILLIGKYFNNNINLSCHSFLGRSVWPNKFRLIKKKERTPFTALDTGKHAYCTQTNIHTYRQNLWKYTIKTFSEYSLPIGKRSKSIRLPLKITYNWLQLLSLALFPTMSSPLASMLKCIQNSTIY